MTRRKNTTQFETVSGDQLRAFREGFLGFSLADTARLLRTPKRTLEDYEAGRRKVPGVVAVAVWLLREREERVTAAIIDDLNREIDRAFPLGIPSECAEEDS